MAGLIEYLESHFSPCFFKSTFGLDCPGCGMQRATVALLKGDVLDSLQYNPGLLPFFITLLFTITHLIFKFKNGPRLVVIGYVGTVSVLFINYILKIAGIIPGHP
jgi:hypothetical protein